MPCIVSAFPQGCRISGVFPFLVFITVPGGRKRCFQKGCIFMLFAKDFRSVARDRLRGCFWAVLLVTLVASLLGGGVANFNAGVRVNFNFTTEVRTEYESLQAMLASLFSDSRLMALAGFLGCYSVAVFLIGGAVSVGLCRYNLLLLGRQERSLRTLWTGFSSFGKALGVVFLSYLYTCFWMVLFIIPGIIASYRYSMALFVLAEDPSIGINEAITVSKQMMKGNKWRLFCLGFSFIGWSMLASLPAAAVSFAHTLHEITGYGQSVFSLPSTEWIGLFVLGILLSMFASLCVSVYQNASVTAFYLDVSGQRHRIDGTAEPAQ